MAEIRKRSAYDRYRSWVLTARETPDLKAGTPVDIFGNALGSMLPVVEDLDMRDAPKFKSWGDSGKKAMEAMVAFAQGITKHPVAALLPLGGTDDGFMRGIQWLKADAAKHGLPLGPGEYRGPRSLLGSTHDPVLGPKLSEDKSRLYGQTYLLRQPPPGDLRALKAEARAAGKQLDDMDLMGTVYDQEKHPHGGSAGWDELWLGRPGATNKQIEDALLWADNQLQRAEKASPEYQAKLREIAEYTGMRLDDAEARSGFEAMYNAKEDAITAKYGRTLSKEQYNAMLAELRELKRATRAGLRTVDKELRAVWPIKKPQDPQAPFRRFYEGRITKGPLNVWTAEERGADALNKWKKGLEEELKQVRADRQKLLSAGRLAEANDKTVRALQISDILKFGNLRGKGK